QGRRDDRRTGRHGQGRVPDRPAPTPRGAGDPLRTAVRGPLPPDLGGAAGRGRHRVLPDHHRPDGGLPMTSSATVAAPHAQDTPSATYRSKVRRRKILVHLTQVAALVVIIGGWQLWVGGDSRKV